MINSFNDQPEGFFSDNEDEADTLQDELQDKPKSVNTSNQGFCLGLGPQLGPNDGIIPSCSESNATFTEDASQSSDDDITNKLTQNLPLYVVNCFLAAGYEVIADMNIVNKPGNSLETIEHYINEQYPGDLSFTHMCGKICKFPPGHRSRIAKFVQTVKEDLRKSKLPSITFGKKRPHDEGNESISKKDTKRRKTASSKSTTNPRNLFSNLRNSLIKWQSSQSKEIQELKENTDFSIKIELDEESGEYMTEIRCKCGSNISLPTMNNKAMISNWTRHIKKNCRGLKTKNVEHKQTSMTEYLSRPSEHQASNANLGNSQCLSSPSTKSSQDFL